MREVRHYYEGAYESIAEERPYFNDQRLFHETASF